MEKFVLQVVGQPGSGKSEVCDFLTEKYDFAKVVVSDLIKNYALGAGINIRERKDHSFVHAQMLRELGNLTIVHSILDIPYRRIGVDGVRVPAHAEELHKYGPIVALHCPPELRFPRALQRRDSIDKRNYEGFLRDEEVESRNEDPFVQSTLTVMETADFNIDTSKPLHLVLEEVSAFVEPLLERR